MYQTSVFKEENLQSLEESIQKKGKSRVLN